MWPMICLEAEFENAGEAGARFLVNTTIGVAGIFDVATDWGLPEREPRFRRDLGRLWRAARAPIWYCPSAARPRCAISPAVMSTAISRRSHFVHYSGSNYVGLVKSSLGSVDNRSANIVTYRDIERASVDYYATMRAYYRQRRERQVEDKPVQTAELPDF